MSSNALGGSSFQWPEPRQGEGWRRAASQMLSPRAAAVEARLNADGRQRGAARSAQADIQRDRAAKVRTPIELGPQSHRSRQSPPSGPRQQRRRVTARRLATLTKMPLPAIPSAVGNSPNPNPPPALGLAESEGARHGTTPREPDATRRVGRANPRSWLPPTGARPRGRAGPLRAHKHATAELAPI